MALSQVAALAEKALGHSDNAITKQDVTNPAIDREKYADPSGAKMKALLWKGKNSVAVEEVPAPRVVEPHDVILKVTGSTVCGSDLHLLHGSIVEMQKGDILGHEFCGTVDSVGDAVTNLKPGQRVVASFQIACGECRFCKRKLSSQCERTNSNTIERGMYGGNTAGMFGYSHFTGGFAGGQAEKVRVPLGDVNLLPIPDDVPDEQALYLSDVLCTSWHCVVDTGVTEGDIVGIWGAGPIGQMCAEFALYHGAKKVILIDGGQGAWRLEYVKSKLEADKIDTIDFTASPNGQNVVGRIKELVPEGLDVALECVAGEYPKGWAQYFELLLGAQTDSSEIVNEMIMSCRSFGRCGITGVYAGFTNHFNIGALMERGIRLIGNGQAPVHLYWEELLKLIQENKIHPLRMLSHRVLVDDLEAVYKAFESKSDGMQKVFVQTQYSDKSAKGTPELSRFGT